MKILPVLPHSCDIQRAGLANVLRLATDVAYHLSGSIVPDSAIIRLGRVNFGVGPSKCVALLPYRAGFTGVLTEITAHAYRIHGVQKNNSFASSFVFLPPFFRWLLHYIQNRKQISTTQSCFCGLVQKYIGGRNRIRTYDLLGQNQALYQLSYAAILMPEAGLEPAIYTEYDSQKWTVHLLPLPSTHLGYSGILKGQSPFFARLAVRTRLCGSRCRSSPVFCSGGA